VGGLGEAKGAMPVLPPGGGVAICAVGRAAWSLEPRLGTKRVWDYTPDEVVSGGTEGVLRCSVGWSGDHRVVSLPPYWFMSSSSASFIHLRMRSEDKAKIDRRS